MYVLDFQTFPFLNKYFKYNFKFVTKTIFHVKNKREKDKRENEK